jgi:hypothetical protein
MKDYYLIFFDSKMVYLKKIDFLEECFVVEIVVKNELFKVCLNNFRMGF